MFHQLLLELLVLGIAALAAAAASMRLRFSPIAGYLLAGILIGPTSLNLLPESESIRLLGEAGVALLMFVVGLEFSWPTLVASRGLVFGRGGLQVFAGAGIGALLGSSIGVGVWAGLLIGAALSMSSTAVVHKQLLDQEESVTPHGIAATGFLLFHDFAALPLLAMLAALDAREAPSSVISTVASLGVSTAAFLLVALLARRTVGHFLSWCARSRYSEVFLLATICLLLGSALTAQRIGLSLPLAAFIVGMIIGESDFRHQLAEELRPFRDLLLALFFLTIGMAIDWRVVWAEPLVALGAFGFLVVFKFALVFLILRLTGSNTETSVRTALLLAHGGELTLLVLTQGAVTGVLPPMLVEPTLAAAAISLLLAPILVQWNRTLAGLLTRASERPDHAAEALIADRARTLRGHVILAGCGPVGRLIAKALEASHIPYIAIERDIARLRVAQELGHCAMFGDATRPGILKGAGLERAAVLVALLNQTPRLQALIRQSRTISPDLPIIVSARDDLGLDPILAAGASLIFPENLAAGLGLAAETLITLGVPAAEARVRIAALRTELVSDLQRRALAERTRSRGIRVSPG